MNESTNAATTSTEDRPHVGTKIIATLGPATASPQRVERLLEAGANVIRINFSHGDRGDHQQMLDAVRQAADKLGRPVAMLGDLCGPKIRLREIEGGEASIDVGDELRIVADEVAGNAERVSVNHPEIISDVQIGHRVLIDDGTIRLVVTGRDNDSLVCRCEVGGVLRDHKGVNLPDSDLGITTITDKDRADIEWAATRELDYLALSFVRRAADVIALREILNDLNAVCQVMAKIETPRAVADIDAIVEASDAVMVARGDLGVEMDVAQVPRIQKDIADRCRRAAKPVVIATQMLQSMVETPIPTRAEVSDVANSIVDCADALLLSAETAVGRYPFEVVQMLGRIALETETYDQYRGSSVAIAVGAPGVRGAVARAVSSLARQMSAAAVAVWTENGELARLVSKHRLDCPVVAFTPLEATRRRTALYYGMAATQVEERPGVHERIALISSMLRSSGCVRPGELVVIGFSPQSVEAGDTGLIVIHVVSSDDDANAGG